MDSDMKRKPETESSSESGAEKNDLASDSDDTKTAEAFDTQILKERRTNRRLCHRKPPRSTLRAR